MRLFLTPDGIATQSGDEYALLDVPHRDPVSALLDREHPVEAAAVLRRAPFDEMALLPPVSAGARLFLLGANYRSHIEEAGLVTPARAAGVAVPASAACGPYQPITLPVEAPTQVDYEGEVAVLVGVGGESIAAGKGWDHIAAVCVANDVSARDVQRAGMKDGRVTDISAVIRGKSFPTFKPLGPCVLSIDEVRGCAPLNLTTRVNGEIRQRASTADMLFDFGQVVEGISAISELKPGDVILTGTPAGIGAVSNRFLAAGDVVEVDVDRIGTLRNAVASG
jgi:2-keto-4-pentenoate hydratase/2-oxohepta-3-ene-1,7-dioic acid hydratase in catechol pathway